MKQIEAERVQLGDAVRDCLGGIGKVVGIDSQGPAVLVKWQRSGAMDVYSLDSPAWDWFEAVREDSRLKCESCGGVILADESGCPNCGRKNLNEAALVEALNVFLPAPGDVEEHDPEATAQLTLPWSK